MEGCVWRTVCGGLCVEGCVWRTVIGGGLCMETYPHPLLKGEDERSFSEQLS